MSEGVNDNKDEEETLWHRLSSMSDDAATMEDDHLAPLLDEINLIDTPEIRSFVRRVLLTTDAFWVAPAEVNFTEVPPDEVDVGGLVLRTKRLAQVVSIIASAQRLRKTEKDTMLAAALIHAATKFSLDKGGEGISVDPAFPVTVGILARVLGRLEGIDSLEPGSSSVNEIDESTRESILRLVRVQDGSWSLAPELVPDGLLEELFFTANYLASKLHLIDNVKFNKED